MSTKISSNFRRSAIIHCAKSVCIRNYSGPYFSAFGLNTERYSMQTRITLNIDTFHTVLGIGIFEGAKLKRKKRVASTQLTFQNIRQFAETDFRGCSSN